MDFFQMDVVDSRSGFHGLGTGLGTAQFNNIHQWK